MLRQTINSCRSKFAVTRICKTLSVSRSQYYHKEKHPHSEREISDMELLQRIKLIHRKSRRLFGSPRVTDKLKEEGVKCNHKKIERLMKDNNIRSVAKKKFKVTTDSNHTKGVSPNLVKRNFKPEKENQLWCSDITYIRTDEGWLYLATVLDLYSRKVIGWSMSKNMSRKLVVDSFKTAWVKRGRPKGLVYHSDRGSQYASDEFRELLEKCEVKQSMSRKGNCWDNACAESFFASLKKEEVYLTSYSDRAEAKRCIFEYIEIFYNSYRPHSFLGGLSPNRYEDKNSREKVA